MGVVLSEEQIAEILDEADHALGEYVQDRGELVFDMSALILTGGIGDGGG